MFSKRLKRSYNISDSKLMSIAEDIFLAAFRDVAELTGYGYDQVAIDAVKQLRDDFAAIPGDEYYSGQMMVATEEKESKLAVATATAEGIVQRAVLQWGKGSSHVKQFGWKGYAAMREGEKLLALDMVRLAATGYLADLASKGLTQQMLDDLAAQINELTVAISMKKKKVKERDEATQNRIRAGNALYDALVDLADTGKHIWEDSDEAKYNDYVIYSAKPAGAEVVMGNPAPAGVHQPSVNIVSAEDRIGFNNTGTVALDIYFSDLPDNQPAGAVQTVAPAALWSGKAGDLGWTAQQYRFLIKNNDPSTAGAFEMVVT